MATQAQVYTSVQAARILKIGHNKLREHVRAGVIRALPGRNIRIPKHAIDEFLKSATREEK